MKNWLATGIVRLNNKHTRDLSSVFISATYHPDSFMLHPFLATAKRALGAGGCPVLAVVLACIASEPAIAKRQWSDVQGRFVVNGSVSRGRPDSLVIDKATGGLANVAVYLDSRQDHKVATHPSYQKTAKADLRLVTRDHRFHPHLLLLRTSQKLLHVNDDDEIHNPNVQLLVNPPRSALIPADHNMHAVRHPREEPAPMPVSCSIHRQMRAFLLIRDSPYMAKSDAKGRFVIKHAPVGKLTFRFWHERIGYLRNIRFGERVSDKRGRLTVDVQPAPKTIIETVTLDPELFFNEMEKRLQRD